MLERTIEQKFVDAVKSAGGWAIKLISPSAAGLPDRLVLLPGGECRFVELKAPGQVMRPLQEKQAEKLRKLGFKVDVIDNIENCVIEPRPNLKSLLLRILYESHNHGFLSWECEDLIHEILEDC